jgi:hypothetical protein
MKKLEKEMNTVFIPELYDKAMDKAFDDKYMAESDDDQGLEQDKDLNINLLKDNIEGIDTEKVKTKKV